MKVTLLQQDIVWGAIKANQTAVEQAIKASPGSDLYVLPEMWSTGFVINPEGIAESPDGDSLRFMQRVAGKYQAAIAGSIAVQTEEGYRNRFYFVKPDGDTVYYDKHHLFSYGGENRYYTAGEQRVIVEWKGVRFLLMVCYDLRFPVWSRNRNDYDAILYVASWPTPRIEAWRILLKARALENQCYVCGVNRIGEDPNCQYCGGTAFITPYGKATECPDNTETPLTQEIDLVRLQAFRQKFPVLKDRD